MYCPNCASPIDGMKFCRSCGSNVSLVPQAMSGQSPRTDAPSEEPHLGVQRLGLHHRRRNRKKEPSVSNAVTELFTGTGFVIVAISILALVPGGVFWWWSFLIPAFALIGAGVGEYLRWKEDLRQQISLERPGLQTVSYQSFSQEPAIPAPTTSELVKPSSVTEHTTRHLE